MYLGWQKYQNQYLMELWSEEFASEIAFTKYCSSASRGGVINPKLGQKGPKLVLHVPMVTERWSSVKGNLTWNIRFWNHDLKILKFWLNVVTLSTQNWLKNCTKDDKKIKILWRHNLKIGLKWLKFVCHVQLVVKILKSGTITTLVQRSFSDGRIFEIWNIDPCCEVRSALILKFKKNCLHKNIPSKSPCRSGFDLCTTNCIWYISLVSFWDYFDPSTTCRTRYANLGLFWPNFRNNDVRTRIKISKFLNPVLRSKYICLTVSINTYFDPFITIWTRRTS